MLEDIRNLRSSTDLSIFSLLYIRCVRRVALIRSGMSLSICFCMKLPALANLRVACSKAPAPMEALINGTQKWKSSVAIASVGVRKTASHSAFNSPFSRHPNGSPRAMSPIISKVVYANQFTRLTGVPCLANSCILSENTLM